MNKILKICLTSVSALISTFFMFIPESLFGKFIFFSSLSNEINIIINRILFSISLGLIVVAIYTVYIKFRKKITIKGKNYIVEVKYGDINEEKNCKKVINFDECYTDKVGTKIYEIKSKSICGQYLLKHSDLDVRELIRKNKINKSVSNSEFKNKTRYDSGTLVPNGDDLLMAFAKLDKDGRGIFHSYQEYINCLSKLWEEIDKYYAQKDVCIPILGGGLTRIGDYSFTKQELLDIIIMSYKLSAYKIKKPYKLCIICKESDDFSLNKIGETL